MQYERVIRIGGYTTVACVDEPGPGGACHRYHIAPNQSGPHLETGIVSFQKGPIQENGVNGIQNEDLLAVVIDRLQGFQSGQFACRENALALTKCQEALLWLEKRTADRVARNVEGKSVV